MENDVQICLLGTKIVEKCHGFGAICMAMETRFMVEDVISRTPALDTDHRKLRAQWPNRKQQKSRVHRRLHTVKREFRYAQSLSQSSRGEYDNVTKV